MSPPIPHGRELLRICAGLGVWASCFVILYAGLSLGCASFIAGRSVAGVPLLSGLLLLIWLGHVAWVGWLLRGAWRRRHGAVDPADRFAARLTWMLHGVGLAATVLTGFPIMLLPPCS